jgi:poly-gamma-glutamate capsule biosynthesis protein CapA/YwtB (metallophosphatase superfamily)
METAKGPEHPALVTLFLCGDVMTGRGVDQVLPHPSDPCLHELYVQSALEYVEMAERKNGPICKPVDFSYIWGDGIEELARIAPDARIVNLETSITTSEDWIAKGINYRMHPGNVPCITAAEIDCCVLANNHVLDWGCAGLADTLRILRKANVKPAGAGLNLAEAEAPAAMEIAGEGRVLVFSFGSMTSGIPPDWAATGDNPGINFLETLSNTEVNRIASRIHEVKRKRDVVVASIHWGDNWGWEIPQSQRDFAHKLVDSAAVDVVHGHSSHHLKGIEVYQGKPILYGCGDFIDDYEGIGGREEYRSELVLMYFVTIDAGRHDLVRLEMAPFEIRRFRLNRASEEQVAWLRHAINRESGQFGVSVRRKSGHNFMLEWR